MTDIASLPSAARANAARAKAPSLPWHVLLWGAVFAAAGAGLLAGRATSVDASGFEDRLVLLLRFMAGMKALMLLGAVALTHWRLAAPPSPGVAAGYIAALATMALAPGLIWSLGHIALGAALFHLGLFGFLILAWRDDTVGRVIEGRRTGAARR